MPIKSILLPIRESDTSEPLIKTGMLAARKLSAHLDVLFVQPDPEEMVPYATLGLSASMKASLISSSQQMGFQQAERLREMFQRLAAEFDIAIAPRDGHAGGPSATWIEETGTRNAIIAAAGRLADLLIVPKPARISPPPSSFEAAIRETGRPVIMIPRQTVQPIQVANVGIGWNGSKEAAQSVAAARHLLREASMVTIFTTEKRAGRQPTAEALIRYLAYHGITANTQLLNTRKRAVGDALLTEATALGCELLVVGGYSRNRLREMVMGGVTQHLMANADIPILMVH